MHMYNDKKKTKYIKKEKNKSIGTVHRMGNRLCVMAFLLFRRVLLLLKEKTTKNLN